MKERLTVDILEYSGLVIVRLLDFGPSITIAFHARPERMTAVGG